ncbi:MAG TPA: exodeoxyribonuclease VII small subunit [Candidatus Baltobacteraceae bacterium]|nr:exodeoxyribonuclease VII small subunit [Candidatus Baltobacteraceae bacterium]
MKALENEDQELGRAVDLYKEGRELVARCEAQLKVAQQAIEAANAPAASPRAAEEPVEDEAPF